jgi:predicted metalloprotease
MSDDVRGPKPRISWLVGALAIVVAVVAVVTVLAVVARQRDGDPGSALSRPEPAASTSAVPSDPAQPEAAADTVALGSAPGSLTTTLAATEDSLQTFWTDQLPAVFDKQFTELRGGFQPKTPSSEGWTCGGKKLSYSDVKDNAFYCGGAGDDYIAYDAADLLPALDKEYGALTPSVVLAHEMGHAIQARVGVQAPSVVMELQADCFAGAWVAFAQSSGADAVSIEESGLDTSVRALPTLRDQPGTPATNAGAHGLAFDRVNAFQTGYEQGAARCATFPKGNVTVTELPFRTVAEAQSGGDLAYQDTVPFVVERLDTFWSAALPELRKGATWAAPQPSPVAQPPLPSCADDSGYDPQAVAAYCGSSNSVAWADAVLAQVHQRIGDLGTATTLSLAWARSAQQQAGLPTTGTGADVQQVCLTGAWVASLAAQRNSQVSLSPGDIDEGLITVLSPLAPGESSEVRGTSFERADAYRTGLLRGLGAC